MSIDWSDFMQRIVENCIKEVSGCSFFLSFFGGWGDLLDLLALMGVTIDTLDTPLATGLVTVSSKPSGPKHDKEQKQCTYRHLYTINKNYYHRPKLLSLAAKMVGILVLESLTSLHLGSPSW